MSLVSVTLRIQLREAPHLKRKPAAGSSSPQSYQPCGNLQPSVKTNSPGSAHGSFFLNKPKPMKDFLRGSASPGLAGPGGAARERAGGGRCLCPGTAEPPIASGAGAAKTHHKASTETTNRSLTPRKGTRGGSSVALTNPCGASHQLRASAKARAAPARDAVPWLGGPAVRGGHCSSLRGSPSTHRG